MGLVLAAILGFTAAVPVTYHNPQVTAAVNPNVETPDAAKLFGEDGNPKEGIGSLTYVYGDSKNELGQVTGKYFSSVNMVITDCNKFQALLNQVNDMTGVTIGDIKLASISGENGSYSGYHYIAFRGDEYVVNQPKWFEGPQIVKVPIAVNGVSVNYNITLPREEAKTYTTEQQEKIHNYIFFGNEESEADNQFEAIRVNEAESHSFESHTFTYRTLKPRGSMAVTLKCDPEKQNYFTVKLWGNDTKNTADGMLWVVDPETNKIGVSPFNNVNESVNVEPVRSGNVDRKQYVELSFLDDAPQCENGFVYSTYKIPKVLTKGKNYVTLRLYSTGEYADYANPSIKEQTRDSRKIYAAYMTQEAQFSPEDFADAGEITVRGSVTEGINRYDIDNAEDVSSIKETMKEYAKQEIDIFMNRQVYSGNRYLTSLKGMFTRNTNASNTATSKNSYTGEGNGMNAQNMTPLNGMEALAYAYAGDFYTTSSSKKDELLDRLICGFDFLTRAQGSNGGMYQKSSNQYQWVGGPERLPSEGNALTGFGLRSVGKAFLLLNEANPDALTDSFETMIDSDADDYNEKDQKRVLAYAALFSKARDFLEAPIGAGHAPNQDMADIIALLRFDQCLEIIDEYIQSHPEIYKDLTEVKETTFNEYSYPFAWTNQPNKKVTIYPGTDYEKTVTGPERVKNSIDIGLGIAPNISTYSYWVSPKGIILENFGSINGGYTGDYGTAAVVEMSQIAEMAAEHYYPEHKQEYWDIMNRVYDSISNFYFIENNGNGQATLYAEGIISERNAKYPGVIRYALDEYSATEMNDGQGNIQALKIMQYYLEHGRIDREIDGGNLTNSGYAHFEDEAVENIKLYYAIENVVAHISDEVKTYEFPMNKDDEDNVSAWADEMAQVVTIDMKGEKIFLNMNFRTWMHSQRMYTHDQSDRIYPSELTRFHRKSKMYDNYGYASTTIHGWSRMNPTAGWNYKNDYIEAMMITRYSDDLTILMNTTGCGLDYCGKGNPIDYTGKELQLDLKTGDYVDLISGQEYTFTKQADIDALSIPHNTTMVLMYKGSLDKHGVTYEAGEGIAVPSDLKQYSKGTKVTVSEEIPQRDGYEFQGWSNSSNHQMVYPGGTFLMGSEDIVLTAVWKKLYSINLAADHLEDSQAAGTLELYVDDLPLSGTQVTAGTQVTVKVIPEQGNRLLALEMSAGHTRTNVTTQVDADRYTFTMPEEEVSIVALFTESNMKEVSLIATEDRGFRMYNRSIQGTAGTLELRNSASGVVDCGFVAGIKFDLSDVLSDMKSTDTFHSFRLQMVTEWAQGTDEYKTQNITLFDNDWAESPDNTNQYADKQEIIENSLQSEKLAQIKAKGYNNTVITNNMVDHENYSLEQYRTVSGEMAQSVNDLREKDTFVTDKKISFLLSPSAINDADAGRANRFLSKDAANYTRKVNGTTYGIEDLMERYHAAEDDFKPTLLIQYGPEQPDAEEESTKALAAYHQSSVVYPLGDTNNDGVITAVDALIALRFAVENQDTASFTDTQKASYEAAKVTGGDTVTTKDVLAILDAAANHTVFEPKIK